jgi:hypothetical protein
MNGIFLIITQTLDFNEYELIGIRSQLRALKFMNVCLVTYAENQLEKFIDIFKDDLDKLDLNKNKIVAEYFDHRYFESIQAYNELLCSIEFYDPFKEYDFIVISQPDVFLLDVNKISELPSLIKEYDYIGAPWVANLFYNHSLRGLSSYFGFKKLLSTIEDYFLLNFGGLFKRPLFNIDQVYLSGNGGFSIRKPLSHIKYLETFSERDKSIIQKFQSQADLKYESNIYAEDIFWCVFSKVLNKKIKIAPSSLSVKFAWEQGGYDRLMWYTKNNLPLAIHAWVKNGLKEFVLNYHSSSYDK